VPAQVVGHHTFDEAKGVEYFVHYPDTDNRENEWVSLERIKSDDKMCSRRSQRLRNPPAKDKAYEKAVQVEKDS